MNTDRLPIVLIHESWMTPLSWEYRVDRYTSEGCTVINRAWPGIDGSVEDLRRDPSGVARVGVTEVVDHHQKIIHGLDRGPGAAGVAIAPAPVSGAYFLHFSTLKLSLPARSITRPITTAPCLSHLNNFTTRLQILSAKKSRSRAFNRYAVPAPDHVLFQATFANFNPHAATAVDFNK